MSDMKDLKELEARLLYDPTRETIQNIFKEMISNKFDTVKEEIEFVKLFINKAIKIISPSIVGGAMMDIPEFHEWAQKYKHLII